MRKFFFAALAAVALVCPREALAQTGAADRFAVSGTLVTVTTDRVTMDVTGALWGAARFKVATAGSATATAQYSIDNGVNWLPAPYAKKLAASANPTIQAIIATTLVTGDTWEIALPGNATNFSIVCAGSGTATSLRLVPALPYTPGVPVSAILADVSESGTGAGLTATVYDVSGWSTLTIWCASPTTQAFVARPIDDAGATMSGSAFTFPVSAGAVVSMSRSGGHASVAAAVTAGSFAAATLIARRIQVSLAAGGTATVGRYRIEASR